MWNASEKRRWIDAIETKMDTQGPLARLAISETLDAMARLGIEMRYCVGRGPRERINRRRRWRPRVYGE